MPNVPRITGAEAKRAFEKAGFYQDRMSGSHCILKKDGHRYHLSIPMHAGKTLGSGLLKSLIDAAGLSVEQFLELLPSYRPKRKSKQKLKEPTSKPLDSEKSGPRKEQDEKGSSPLIHFFKIDFLSVP